MKPPINHLLLDGDLVVLQCWLNPNQKWLDQMMLCFVASFSQIEQPQKLLAIFFILRGLNIDTYGLVGMTDEIS